MSSKNTEKKLVGQPIFKQIIDFTPKEKLSHLVIQYKADLYYRHLIQHSVGLREADKQLC